GLPPWFHPLGLRHSRYRSLTDILDRVLVLQPPGQDTRLFRRLGGSKLNGIRLVLDRRSGLARLSIYTAGNTRGNARARTCLAPHAGPRPRWRGSVATISARRPRLGILLSAGPLPSPPSRRRA